MRTLIPAKFLLPLGLLLLALSFIPMPDFLSGFLKGVSIVLICGALIRRWYMKQTS